MLTVISWAGKFLPSPDKPRFINNCLQESKRLNDLRGEHTQTQRHEKNLRGEMMRSSGFLFFFSFCSFTQFQNVLMYLFSDMSTKKGDTCQWQISNYLFFFVFFSSSPPPNSNITKLNFFSLRDAAAVPDVHYRKGTPFLLSTSKKKKKKTFFSCRRRSNWIDKKKWVEKNDRIRALTLSNDFLFLLRSSII